MGRSPARDRLFINLSRAVATLAKGIDMVAAVTDPGHSVSRFTRGFVFAQISAVQAHADVRRGEADQRRRLVGLGESLVSLERPHGTRLSLLVATVANSVQLVGGQKPGMVQAFFSRILSRRRNHRAVFDLGAATSTSHRRWIDNFSSTRYRHHRQLLLFQSADDRVMFVIA